MSVEKYNDLTKGSCRFCGLVKFKGQSLAAHECACPRNTESSWVKRRRMAYKGTSIAELRKLITEATAKIEEIQSTCAHPYAGVTRTPNSDGGCFDRSAEYWYDCECKLCEKKWTEPQEEK